MVVSVPPCRPPLFAPIPSAEAKAAISTSIVMSFNSLKSAAARWFGTRVAAKAFVMSVWSIESKAILTSKLPIEVIGHRRAKKKNNIPSQNKKILKS